MFKNRQYLAHILELGLKSADIPVQNLPLPAVIIPSKAIDKMEDIKKIRPEVSLRARSILIAAKLRHVYHCAAC
ncbi:hypothetical protein [Falsihalocynthiibacter arcticus]|uniref:Uncharacterized protein n=1 Tax=Falsihalocynthiibacter arcticus TaxID=1579316 RepID=A0A126V4A2_9RHOB|nr:hypothetical protein [Falsihalocynthiibacter arcticus]AML53161.1 hypothetical protein RC74_19575 [Falsihalocynthiibacter arcticus]